MIMLSYRQSEKTETITLSALLVNQYKNNELHVPYICKNYQLQRLYIIIIIIISFIAHTSPVTAVCFAPFPGITVGEGVKEIGHLIVAGDYKGTIKVYVTSENL